MIARDAESHALHLNSPATVDFQTSIGDELPSISCDPGDLNISATDFDQLVLQSLRDVPLSLDGLSMDNDEAAQNGAAAQPICELTNMIFQETKGDRNFDLSFPVDASLISFINSLPNTSEAVAGWQGGVTPPFSGGSTPQSQSRAPSPAWSESSGNMSTSSVSGASSYSRKCQGTAPVPRHKRPSHRRAEVKRRDKIKTCLDDIKGQVPSLQDKGKLSESAILLKAAEYIHQLKDGFSERGNKASELRREIHCLSEEIHSFQETLPAGGLKEEGVSRLCLDDLYSKWVAEQRRISTKHFIFTAITSSLFDSFKEVVGNASSLDSMACRMKEWQTKFLSLPVLRKQILHGMLKLTRDSSVVSFPKDLNQSPSSSVDGHS